MYCEFTVTQDVPFPYNVPSGQDTVRNIWEVILCLVSTVAIAHAITTMWLPQSWRAQTIITVAIVAVTVVAIADVAAETSAEHHPVTAVAAERTGM